MMTIFEIFIYHIIILKKRICLLMPMALLLQVFACHLTLACRITSGALFTKVIVCTVRLSCITGLLLQIFSASRDLNPPRRSSRTCCARRASSSGRAGGQRRGTGNVLRGVGPGGGGRRKASRTLARGTVLRAVELKVAGGIMADTADSEGGGAAQLRAGQLYPAPTCDWSRLVTPAGKSARRPQRLLTQR